jgi:hypothetical protein
MNTLKVRKFCLCGVKLERTVSSEDAARTIVEEFRRAHSGNGHGPATAQEYLLAVSRIVARNARSNRPREAKPLLTEIARVESQQINHHNWMDHFGLIFCSTCYLVQSNKTVGTVCAKAALMKPSEFIGYPLPWFSL